MTYFGLEGWVALSVIAAAGILTFLHVLARMSESARAVTALRVEASGLRRGYAERLAALRAREAGAVIEVDVADEQPAEAELRRAA